MQTNFLEKSLNKKKRPKKRPRRLENPGEMYKYFISRTSLHGIKYSQDAELYKVERVIWLLLVIAGFYCAVKVIIQLYDKFHVSACFNISHCLICHNQSPVLKWNIF